MKTVVALVAVVVVAGACIAGDVTDDLAAKVQDDRSSTGGQMSEFEADCTARFFVAVLGDDAARDLLEQWDDPAGRADLRRRYEERMDDTGVMRRAFMDIGDGCMNELDLYGSGRPQF